MERTSKKNFIIDVFYFALVGLLIFFVAYAVIKFLFPFVIGVALAYAVQKPSEWISRKIKLKKGYIAAALSVLVYLLVGAVFVFLIYRLIMSAVGLADSLPGFLEKTEGIFGAWSEKFSSHFEFLSRKFDLNFESFIQETLQKFGDKTVIWITNAVTDTVKKLPLYFVTGIVTLVATCFIAKDFEHLSRFVKSLIGKANSQKMARIKNIFIGSVLRLTRGYFILAFITFTELYLGFLLLKIPSSLTLALIISVVDLLPVIGTGTVMVPWAVIAVLSGNYSLGIGLGVLFIVVTVVRNFSEPKIIGMQIGINPLFTLISMFLGLKLLGVWGLVLFPVILIVVIRYYKDEMQEGLSE